MPKPLRSTSTAWCSWGGFLQQPNAVAAVLYDAKASRRPIGQRTRMQIRNRPAPVTKPRIEDARRERELTQEIFLHRLCITSELLRRQIREVADRPAHAVRFQRASHGREALLVAHHGIRRRGSRA